MTKEELVAGIREFWTSRVTKERCQRYIEHVRTKVVLLLYYSPMIFERETEEIVRIVEINLTN